MSKRQAGTQITKDREDEDWGRDGPPDPVEQASEEVLATRKIALPKSRKRTAASDSESVVKAANPFAFNSAATSASPAPSSSNAFANIAAPSKDLQSTRSNPFGSISASAASTTPVFSFGSTTTGATAPNLSASSTASPIDSFKTVEAAARPEGPSTQSASNDTEYDVLLRQRSLNVSFMQAVKACLENDAFADLTTICTEYQSHQTASQNVPIQAAKGTNGTGIYPSFHSSSTSNHTGEPEARSTLDEKVPKAAESSAPSAPSFSFNASAPAFAFKAPESTSTKPAFGFDGGAGKESASSSQTEPPHSLFGQQTDRVEKEDKTASTPVKSLAETKANDFSWTPDRGIKFGDSSSGEKKKEEQTRSFGFNNPLASPSQTTTTAQSGSDPVAKPAPSGFTFGSTSATGFSFGQSAPTTEQATKEPSSASTPVFSFGASATTDTAAKSSSGFAFGSGTSSTPAFSFSSNTTPSFSFQSAKKDETKDENSAAADTKAAEAQESPDKAEDGDAMPDEPRTNDALIAGPGVGEEEEEEVFVVPRIKLFKYNPDDKTAPWTDLGICILRVLVHKETKKARMIARAEGAGALRLNARMYSHFKYTLEGKSNVKVYNLVESNKTETYLVKIKDPSVAKELLSTLNEKKA